MSEGYETVTTRQLAERVGISQTGLYVYFKNKEEILQELRQSMFRRLATAVPIRKFLRFIAPPPYA